MKFVKKISLLALLLSAAFNINAFAQDGAAERFDTKNITRADKTKGDTKEAAKEAVAGSADLITAATYAFSTQNGVALEDISSGPTTLIASSSDDGNSTLQNIGFDFWYDGVRYTQFSCNANGFCRLGGTVVAGTSFDNSTGFASTTNAPKIAPYYDDLWVGTNGQVRYKVVGTPGSRRLVVEWYNMNVPRLGAAAPGTATFQLWLYESAHPTQPGVIQFVYGTGMVVNSANGGYSVGLQSGAATNFASVTTATDTVSYAAANNTQTNAIPAGKSYLFTPNVPAAPSGLNFTAITPTSQTLNWIDNSANEAGFVIYRSTDGINFSLLTQTAANATSFNDTGLSPSTNYFYRVYSVSEGALSTTFDSGSQTTAPAGNDSCSGTPTVWSAPTSWADGTVPTAGDNVTVQSGCTLTLDATASIISLTVGGTLTYDTAVARTLTVAQAVTINAGGILQTSGIGTVTTHVLSVGTNLTNDGTLDFSTNANTAGGRITFTGAANNTFGGTGGTTDVRDITINKGTSSANVLELNPTNFTVRGATTDSTSAAYLTLTNGTFKISGTFTAAFRTFTSAGYSIPATAGFWLNNPNYTVSGQNGSPTTSGLLRISQGTFNVGTAAGNAMDGATGAVFIIEGGTSNFTGRFSPQGSVSYTQTGGVMNVATVGNAAASFGSFEIFGASSVSNMSGGTINLVQASTGSTPWDFNVRGTLNYSGAGTTVNAGTAATTTNFNFRFQASVPNLNIDNTTNNKTVTFVAQTLIYGNVLVNPGTTYNHNGFLVVLFGANAAPTFTNNGTVSGSTAGSQLYFANGATPFTYTGTGVNGTVAAPIATVSIDSLSSVNFTPTNNVITKRVNLFTGSVTGAAKITLGNNNAVVNIVQIGNSTTPTAAGTFDAPMTFDLGTGGETVLYLRTNGNRTTGGEINPARTLVALTYDDNTAGRTLTVADGNLTVSGALTLTNGVIVTSPTNTLVHNGAATRTAGFVDGPLMRDFAVAPVTAYTFHVGEGVYSPVGLANITAAGSTLSVEAINATLTPFSPANSISRNWSLNKSAAGTLTADLSFTYDQTDDVNGNEADYRLFRRDSGVTTEVCGIACVDEATNVATATGVTSFSRWTIAEAIAPTAASVNIGGRVTTADGMTGLGKVQVVLSGSTLAQPRVMMTSPFGYYNFEELPVGTYVLQVASKQYTFSVPTRVITAEDSILNADFTANP